MKLITRDTDYVIRALCYIAESKDKVVSAAELVEKLKLPKPFLRKTLQILNKKKILNSYKGLGGGFSLAVSPSKISVIDLMRIFQGPIKINECLFKKKVCPDLKKCPLRKKIDCIERKVLSDLGNITIASLTK
ncbi:RrF2 family transcriptional regulator [Candidatus Omnitrophota bacterium]